jgi:hypothetical protein
MNNIGFNIYYWGMQEQQRLLQHGLGVWARDARDQGLLQRLWFCPYDARGPHVFAIFTTTSGAQDEVKTFLNDRIEDFITQFPSEAGLSAKEISERHGHCRGRSMNAADRQPGLAENNTFQIFEHEPADYPFRLNQRVSDTAEFWNRLDQVASWTLEQAGGDVSRWAIRWLAAIDRSLHQHDIAPADYWRYHAGTLLLGLEESARARPEAVNDWLQKAVTLPNRELFSLIWEEAETTPPLDISGLVHLVLSHSALTLTQRFSVLREINHFTLLQLGQIVRREIPIVLYGWQRNS